MALSLIRNKTTRNIFICLKEQNFTKICRTIRLSSKINDNRFDKDYRIYFEPSTGDSQDYFDHPRNGRQGRYDKSFRRSAPFRDGFNRFEGYRNNEQAFQDLKKKQFDIANLEPIEKNFYVEHQTVKDRPIEETEQFYESENITVPKGQRPVPLNSFHEANFPAEIFSRLTKNKWNKPTPIQSIGWPVALSGKNMVGIAQTGSGKTLGFVLPAFVHLKHQRKIEADEGPIVLVLAPTRELAQQIGEESVRYGRPLGIKSFTIYGGASKNSQAMGLYEQPQVVIATPGRLLDFLQTGTITLNRTTFVVLDEADRMLDMGFEPQLRKILDQVRPDRQILMWSATWPKEIQNLAYDFLGEFTQINVGNTELTANKNISQSVLVCNHSSKLKHLLDIVHEHEGEKILVFTSTKANADRLARYLYNRRIRARAMHGDKSQTDRNRTLYDFKSGYCKVLVATDVAARGLDVNDIKLVVNFDCPNDSESYIHRIGRTGRAEKKGTALTLITEDDAHLAQSLIHVLESGDQPVDQALRRLAAMSEQFKHSKMDSQRYRGHRSRSYDHHNRRDFYRDRSHRSDFGEKGYDF